MRYTNSALFRRLTHPLNLVFLETATIADSQLLLDLWRCTHSQAYSTLSLAGSGEKYWISTPDHPGHYYSVDFVSFGVF